MNGSEVLSQPGGLRRFAEANGWRYEQNASPPALSGMWEQVSHGVVRERVVGEGWEVGHITGGTRSAQAVERRGSWTVTKTVSVSTPVGSVDLGYLAITLPRRLPHMVLDAKSNDRGPFSSLINRPKADQVLSLEGDFDTHFRLYVPTGYERDALYVFTPDLMALLIDEAGDLDVEVRDDRLIVYKPGGFDLTAADSWSRFENIRGTLGAKAWTQTDMYLDERVGTPPLIFAGPAENIVGPAENIVGDGGQRLRKRMPRLASRLLVLAGVVLVFIGGVAAFVISRLPGW